MIGTPPIYAVAEIFPTIQGEATFAGTPSVFVRLQGCDVGCPWCDTRPTWETHPEDELAILPLGPRIGTVDPKARRMTFARMGPAAIARAARSLGNAKHAVITGGEPFQQAIGALIRALAAEGFHSVQIETSGTAELGDIPGWSAPGLWITLSPKIGMPGGKAVLTRVVRRADEMKWPVGKPADLDRLQAFLDEHKVHGTVPIWLQPLSQQAKATALCVEAAQVDGRWRVSIQTHKYMGIA